MAIFQNTRLGTTLIHFYPALKRGSKIKIVKWSRNEFQSTESKACWKAIERIRPGISCRFISKRMPEMNPFWSSCINLCKTGCLAHRGSTVGFLFAPVFQWCCSAPRGSPVVGCNTFLSSPHLCFIIVFICDLFVSRGDLLMS